MRKTATKKRGPDDEPVHGDGNLMLASSQAMSDEEQTIVQVGRTVLAFLSKVAEFLTVARKIEAKANTALTTARTLRVPTDSTSDEMMQRFVLGCADGVKEATDHWSICQAISRFHKMMTGARGRAVDAYEEARRIGNGLHNEYTAAERRRVQEENDRRRREEEQRAQAQRDREAAEAEEAAVRAEASSPELSDREALFVHRLMQGDTPMNAARTAGFKNHGQAADRLMASPKINQAIEARRRAETIRQQSTARQQQPLDVQHEEVRPDIVRAVGAKDRTTKSAELLDENALIAACIQGKHGIPWDILTVKPAKLNEYARGMGALINKWPGVRYKEETGVTR